MTAVIPGPKTEQPDSLVRYAPRSAEEDMPTEVAIASTLVPYSRDDARARYLGYMSCGFDIRETLQLIGRKKSWLSWCRTDPKFVELENNLPEIRKSLAKEYIELEFYRNFRLVLEKDYRILRKTLNPDQVPVVLADGSTKEVDAVLPRQDQEYLLKIRSQYNAQQLQIIEALVSGAGGGFNFAQWVAENQEVVQISRTDTVTMQRGE